MDLAPDQPKSDLIGFLQYLVYIRQSKGNSSNNDELKQESVNYKSILDDFLNAKDNRTSLNDLNTDELLFLKDLPVALIQLFILIFVFLIILCMCKCNGLLSKCRERTPKTQEELMEEMYHDKKRLIEYCSHCCLFVHLKFLVRRMLCMSRTNRTNSSEKRRFRRNRFIHKRLSDGLFKRYAGANVNIKHKQSAIFKRRAVIYRNQKRTYKTNVNAYVVSTSNQSNDEQMNNQSSTNAINARSRSPVVSFIPSYLLKQHQANRKNSYTFLYENKNMLNQKIQIINESVSV